MDVAGTLLGAVSLGITLCDSLVAYCRAWKHQDDDVASLASLCKGVRELLQNIEHCIQRSPTLDAKLIETLNNTLQGCTSHCEAVIRLSDKYTPGPPTSTWKDRARELLQKLKFPFEKKALEEIQGIMIAFRGNVDTALGLLNL